MPHTWSMRKRDCEITDPVEIRAILDEAERCRLAFTDGTLPYIVPMNYAYTYDHGALTLFFHSAEEGRKIDMIRTHPIVSFEVDTMKRLNPDDSEKRYAVKWESLVGSGTLAYVTEPDGKKAALTLLIEKYTRFNPNYIPAELTDEKVRHVTVFRLKLDEFKAKRVLHR